MECNYFKKKIYFSFIFTFMPLDLLSIYLNDIITFLLLAWLVSGRSLLEGFSLTRVPMMIMSEVFWQNWSNNVVDSLPQRWKEWSAISNLRKQKLICYNQLFWWVDKRKFKCFCFATRLQIWHWQRRIKLALRSI